MSKTTEKAADKIRVYILAKELKLETKDMLDICKELGFEAIKNQLTSLEPDQVVLIKKRLKDGPKSQSPVNTVASKPIPTNVPPKALDHKIRTLPPPKKSTTVIDAEPVIPQPVVEVAQPDVIEDTPVVAVPEVVAEATPVVEPVPVVELPPEVVVETPLPANVPPPSSVMPINMSIQSRGVQSLLNPNKLPSIGNRASGPQRPQNLPTRAATPASQPQQNQPQQPQAPRPTQQQPQTTRPPQQQQAPASQPAGVPGQQRPPLGPPPPRNPQNIPGQGQRSHHTPGGGQHHRSGPGGGQMNRPGARPQQGQGGQGGGPTGGPGAGQSSAPKPSVTAAGGKQVKLTLDQIKRLREIEGKRGQKVSTGDAHKQLAPVADKPDADKPRDEAKNRGHEKAPPRTEAESEEDKRKTPGIVAGREGRHAQRQGRDKKASTDKGGIIIGAHGSVEQIDQQSGSRRGPRAALMAKMKRRQQQTVIKKEGPVEITVPITVRALSEAIGMKVGDLSKQLFAETQQLYGVNSVIAFDVAELVAINKGITLVQKKQESAKEKLLRVFKEQAETVEADKLRPRPPIVVIMGHVDHGKTTLLDRIREEYGLASDIVSTEAGGITQVLRAWRVEKDGKPITFLDTPGHEAFTKMRARGANVTDIAVIVVAATDGVMPQTEEAISHAKAAGVDIIVAINKVDMPNANLDKTRRQLYQLELLPDNMGGDIQFIETSAVTGQGVGELLDAIALVAELSDPPLTADPEHKPSGTCLEAYMDGDKGVMATLLVQQGTLRKGDVILCGATFGRVRAMLDDLGRPIKEAGPSTPVKVFGLDEVPDADDPFYFVEDLTKAAEIAEKERIDNRERGLTNLGPKSLDQLKEAHAKVKITELKVVLKAEARGSVEAIRKELEKLVHDEVRCRVLHAGIGAINESDLTLALTSPEDTLVIGFNVTADDTALKIAEARGISLREYQIIYNLVDDVKAALEGRLKPIEEVVHLGRAVIRETFKISKVGTIAGCYVTSGTLERNARIRVIRDGTVIYPPPDRNLGLDSLKRFKDDAKEVREGFECGLKLTGFDDIKVGDVIEAFRIDIKKRVL